MKVILIAYDGLLFGTRSINMLTPTIDIDVSTITVSPFGGMYIYAIDGSTTTYPRVNKTLTFRKTDDKIKYKNRKLHVYELVD